MTKQQIYELVKKLEPYFIGYEAVEDTLKNSNGMELFFRVDWKNRTRVVGMHAKHRHSIGCSFEKSPEKIFKDVWRRLMPDYRGDFFETKRENIERAEIEEAENLKLWRRLSMGKFVETMVIGVLQALDT